MSPVPLATYLLNMYSGSIPDVLDMLFDMEVCNDQVLDKLINENGGNQRLDQILHAFEIWMVTKVDDDSRFRKMLQSSTLMTELWKDHRIQEMHFNLRYPAVLYGVASNPHQQLLDQFLPQVQDTVHPNPNQPLDGMPEMPEMPEMPQVAEVPQVPQVPPVPQHQCLLNDFRYSNLFYSSLYTIDFIRSVYTKSFFTLPDIRNIYDYCVQHRQYEKITFLYNNAFVLPSTWNVEQLIKLKDFDTNYIVFLVTSLYCTIETLNSLRDAAIKRNDYALIYAMRQMGVKFDCPRFLKQYTMTTPNRDILLMLFEDCTNLRKVPQKRVEHFRSYFNFHKFVKVRPTQNVLFQSVCN